MLSLRSGFGGILCDLPTAYSSTRGVLCMLLTLLQFFATKFLVLALHLEAGSFPKPLSAREEIEAFAALRAGDRSAREKIIRHNLRLVAHVAKKYYAQPGDQEDLISIGTIGLMKAVDTFDTTRKARFATYASRCIENAILSRMRLWFQTSIPRAEKNRDGVFWHRYPRICISFALLWTAA